MARSSLHCLPIQLSPLTYTSFLTFPLQPYILILSSTLSGRSRPDRLRFAQASPLASRLAINTHRIEFTCIWDCSFALGCFPPRLTATQFPSALPPFSGSVAFRFSLTGLYIVMITLATALCRCAVHSKEVCQRYHQHL